MTSDILDPSAVLAVLPALLPPSSKTLVSPQDAIAALVHAALTLLAFRLIAADEPSTSPAPSANILPEGWNKSGPGHYTFKYKHDQSSLEFLIKLSKLGTRTVINAIALEVSSNAISFQALSYIQKRATKLPHLTYPLTISHLPPFILTVLMLLVPSLLSMDSFHPTASQTSYLNSNSGSFRNWFPVCRRKGMPRK